MVGNKQGKRVTRVLIKFNLPIPPPDNNVNKNYNNIALRKMVVDLKLALLKIGASPPTQMCMLSACDRFSFTTTLPKRATVSVAANQCLWYGMVWFKKIFFPKKCSTCASRVTVMQLWVKGSCWLSTIGLPWLNSIIPDHFVILVFFLFSLQNFIKLVLTSLLNTYSRFPPNLLYVILIIPTYYRVLSK